MRIERYENSKFVRFAYRFRDFNYLHLKRQIKFWLLFFGLIIFILFNIFQVIQIRIFFNTQTFGFLWTILNALVWNVYINALGIFNTGIRKTTYKYVILLIGIIIILLGFGFFNVVIRLNFTIFLYPQFSTSSSDGIWFFWLNIYLWIPIYFITFLIESEYTIENF